MLCFMFKGLHISRFFKESLSLDVQREGGINGFTGGDEAEI